MDDDMSSRNGPVITNLAFTTPVTLDSLDMPVDNPWVGHPWPPRPTLLTLRWQGASSNYGRSSQSIAGACMNNAMVKGSFFLWELNY